MLLRWSVRAIARFHSTRKPLPPYEITKNKLLEGLNEYQCAAVLADTNKPLYAMANKRSETWKKKVLERRAVFCAARSDTGPGKVLLVSTTNQATDTFCKRLSAFASGVEQHVLVSTLRKLITQIFELHYKKLGFKYKPQLFTEKKLRRYYADRAYFSILSKHDQLTKCAEDIGVTVKNRKAFLALLALRQPTLIKSMYRQLRWKDKQTLSDSPFQCRNPFALHSCFYRNTFAHEIEPHSTLLFRVIAVLKRQGGNIDDAVAEGTVTSLSAKHFKMYQKILHHHSLVEFDDLPWLTLQLLRQNPDIVDEMRARFSHVIVQEAHTIKEVEVKILLLLNTPRLSFVGNKDKWNVLSNAAFAPHVFECLQTTVRDAGHGEGTVIPLERKKMLHEQA